MGRPCIALFKARAEPFNKVNSDVPDQERWANVFRANGSGEYEFVSNSLQNTARAIYGDMRHVESRGRSRKNEGDVVFAM